MRRRRSHDVAPVECVRNRLAPIPAVFQGIKFHGNAVQFRLMYNPGQQPVIGRDVIIVPDLRQENIATCPDAGIDNGNMNRARREKSSDFSQRQRA